MVIRKTSLASRLVPIARYTAANAATLSTAAIMSAAYGRYIFDARQLIPQTGGADLRFLIGTGAAPTFQTGANYYRVGFHGRASDSSTREYATAGEDFIKLNYSDSGFGVSNHATEATGWSGLIEFINPSNSERRKMISIDGAYTAFDGNSILAPVRGNAVFVNAVTAITAGRFLFGSGNITGELFVYAVRGS